MIVDLDVGKFGNGLNSIIIKDKNKKNGKMKYKCSQCKQVCKAQSSAMYHYYKMHTSKFQCNTCNTCFGSQNALTKHIRTHTNEKPFQCNVCKKRFTQKSNLNSHVKRYGHHGSTYVN